MIWTSVALMTVIDLVIIAVAVIVLWRNFWTSHSRRPSAPKAGLRLIMVGILVVGLFYFADLLSMHVLPAFIPMEKAMGIMGRLHRNLSWMVALFAIVVISVGFMELKRTQEELAEKNQLLEDLSSKLSRYLSPQVYESIFRGEQNVEITSKRKKLTVFFSDIGLQLLSRAMGQNRIIDEFILRFTHTVRMDCFAPAIEPTGRRLEVPHVGVIEFEGDKIASEHICWDHASVLIQLGVLVAERLPALGVGRTGLSAQPDQHGARRPIAAAVPQLPDLAGQERRLAAQPLCFAQIGGLLVATFVTPLLVPVVFSTFVLDLKVIKWPAHEAAAGSLTPQPL